DPTSRPSSGRWRALWTRGTSGALAGRGWMLAGPQLTTRDVEGPGLSTVRARVCARHGGHEGVGAAVVGRLNWWREGKGVSGAGPQAVWGHSTQTGAGPDAIEAGRHSMG